MMQTQNWRHAAVASIHHHPHWIYHGQIALEML
jgi:hypothetical protein